MIGQRTAVDKVSAELVHFALLVLHELVMKHSCRIGEGNSLGECKSMLLLLFLFLLLMMMLWLVGAFVSAVTVAVNLAIIIDFVDYNGDVQGELVGELLIYSDALKSGSLLTSI